jgi:hypothetical protein
MSLYMSQGKNLVDAQFGGMRKHHRVSAPLHHTHGQKRGIEEQRAGGQQLSLRVLIQLRTTLICMPILRLVLIPKEQSPGDVQDRHTACASSHTLLYCQPSHRQQSTGRYWSRGAAATINANEHVCMLIDELKGAHRALLAYPPCIWCEHQTAPSCHTGSASMRHV